MSSVLRSFERSRAKVNMKRVGIQKFCKHDYSSGTRLNGKPGDKIRLDSVFAEKWREFSPKGVNQKVNAIKKGGRG